MLNMNPLPEGLSGSDYHGQFSGARTVPWTEPGLYITRLRLIGDGGVLDVSYCHGRLKDGTLVKVEVPFDQLSLRWHRKQIVRHAKADGVYAVGLGIFDNLSILH